MKTKQRRMFGPMVMILSKTQTAPHPSRHAVKLLVEPSAANLFHETKLRHASFFDNARTVFRGIGRVVLLPFHFGLEKWSKICKFEQVLKEMALLLQSQ